eukprot:UN15517
MSVESGQCQNDYFICGENLEQCENDFVQCQTAFNSCTLDLENWQTDHGHCSSTLEQTVTSRDTNGLERDNCRSMYDGIKQIIEQGFVDMEKVYGYWILEENGEITFT